MNVAISNLNVAVPSTILISNDILLDDSDIFVNLFLSAISSPCYAELFVISLESSREWVQLCPSKKCDLQMPGFKFLEFLSVSELNAMYLQA